MATLFRIPRKRHMRHAKISRLDRSLHLHAFLNERVDVLDTTGAAKTFTLDTNAYGATAGQTLTATGQPSATETITVGEQVYTFVAALTVPAVANEVLIGVDAATTLANLAAAINAGSGAGTTYGTGTIANADATATSDATHVVLTATATYSVAGNSVVTTETASNMGFAAATMTGGADPTNNIAITTHGYSVGEGPFLLTTSGALPGGLELATLYYIHTVVSSGVIKLCTDIECKKVAKILSAGSGTQTITKASTSNAIFQTMKRNKAVVVANATDIDTL